MGIVQDSSRTEKIQLWVSDFCSSDAANIHGVLEEYAPVILCTFLESACAVRNEDPEELGDESLATALVGDLARLDLPASVREQVPDLIAECLHDAESRGRFGGGQSAGLRLRAMKPRYLAAAGGPMKPIRSPAGTKLGRNDDCPCGSGRKYKKCCMNL